MAGTRRRSEHVASIGAIIASADPADQAEVYQGTDFYRAVIARLALDSGADETGPYS